MSGADPRFARAVNTCQQLLLQRPEKWWGTYARYRVCVTSSCLVWPRQFASIEAIAVCDVPVTIRNEWFEFLSNAAGIQQDGGNCNSAAGCTTLCGGTQLYDRGTVCSFDEIIGTNKKIKVYADVSEDAGSKILLQGHDENNNWIRTLVSGSWVDGEYVTISSVPGGTLSTNFFTSLTSVQKPVTNGTVRLYEYDTDLATQRAIAIYEHDETRPVYRKSLVTGLNQSRISDGSCRTIPVTVMAKLEFIPATVDTDWLLIGNLRALEDMAQSVMKKQNNLFEEAVAWEASALKILQNELRHYTGTGVVSPIRTQSADLSGAGVMNLI